MPGIPWDYPGNGSSCPSPQALLRQPRLPPAEHGQFREDHPGNLPQHQSAAPGRPRTIQISFPVMEFVVAAAVFPGFSQFFPFLNLLCPHPGVLLCPMDLLLRGRFPVVWAREESLTLPNVLLRRDPEEDRGQPSSPAQPGPQSDRDRECSGLAWPSFGGITTQRRDGMEGWSGGMQVLFCPRNLLLSPSWSPVLSHGLIPVSCSAP